MLSQIIKCVYTNRHFDVMLYAGLCCFARALGLAKRCIAARADLMRDPWLDFDKLIASVSTPMDRYQPYSAPPVQIAVIHALPTDATNQENAALVAEGVENAEERKENSFSDAVLVFSCSQRSSDASATNPIRIFRASGITRTMRLKDESPFLNPFTLQSL